MILLKDPLAVTSGNSNTVWTYSGTETPGNISFINDSVNTAIVTVRDYVITVKAGESLGISIPVPFHRIEIQINGNYRMFIGR